MIVSKTILLEIVFFFAINYFWVVPCHGGSIHLHFDYLVRMPVLTTLNRLNQIR